MLDEKSLLIIANACDLDSVEELHLSHRNLADGDLNPEVINKCTNLVELNLSNNRMSCIPDEISLPSLRYLNISNNVVSDVMWFTRFPSLEDIDISENFLTVDDSYKLVYLLKHLKYIDGKHVDHGEKIRHEFGISLVKAMEHLWSTQYKGRWQLVNKPSYESKRKVLIDEFSSQSSRLKIGPNSLKGFRKWRVNNIVEKVFNSDIKNPQSCFAQLLKFGNDSNDYQCKWILGKRAINDENRHKQAKKKINSKSKNLNFEPRIFWQCHSQEDGSSDFTTQVWCCAFEPDVKDNLMTTNIFASCGGNSVCLIDCETLKVESRFQQANEEFYTLSWTTVMIEGRATNLLLAAGNLGFIHLIHSEQALCYGRIKVHSSPVQTIRFLKDTLLVSAEKNGTVYLTDIDIPTIPEYKFSWKKLVKFSGLDCAPLRLLLSDDGLFCGTERGLFFWNATEVFGQKTISSTMKAISLSCEVKFPNVEDETMVDAIEFLTDDLIASKCPQQSEIFLWKYTDFQSKRKHSKSKQLCVELYAKLAWSNTNQCYINFTVCRGLGVLLAGDQNGSIWVYDAVASLPKSKANFCILPPDVIVPFPKCCRKGNKKPSQLLINKTIYNDITCSSDLSHVVVAGDNNLVGVFHKNRS